MIYYKVVINGEIVQIGSQDTKPSNAIEITYEEYTKIFDDMSSENARLANLFHSVVNKEITIEDIENEEDKEIIKSRIESIPQPEPQKYTLDEAAALLTEEVANEL